MPRLLPALLAILLLPAASAGNEPAAVPTYERDVLPILSSHCLPCHGGIHQRGGLDLRTATSALAGGDSGKVIVPGDPKASDLWKVVEAGTMPKGPIKVSAADKEVIRAWIAGGAKSAPFGGQLRVPPKARTAKELAEFIDREIDRRLADAKVPASPAADDGELSACLFGSSAAPAVDPAPAFTKEAQGDWYVLAAHQNNKNIALGKRVGSRVAVAADGVVWHDPEKADTPLVSAKCARAAADPTKKQADPNELTSIVTGSLCPKPDAKLAARWRLTDNDVLLLLVEVAEYKGNRNGTYSGAAPSDVIFIC